MLNQRQQALLDLVKKRGFMSVEALAQQFDVTMQTIRRDINQLAEMNLLRRYHGGAGLPSSVENIAYTQRKVLHADSKRQIAQSLAEQIEDGQSLIINLGTTTEEVARALLSHKNLSVITNNLNVAAILADNPEHEVIVAGGVVRSRDRGITGEATIDFIRQFKVDIGIIGVSSIDPDGTLRDYDYREVKVAQTIIEQSRQVWLVADHSKFSREALVKLAHISQVDVLFTDIDLSEEMKAVLREAGTRVVVATEV
ncbi:DeoR family transcriptional regulator [Leeia sp. TBRC 13508]|uniref:DeoR family transcriptional regulator n=1 Tax=Leeia speluncae TaxID=2884804 RepID=A0ABS8D6Q6_9NEIS|nr:DeoR family transcriptional regulator [Leeia speluncae]MCB6183874.1 DeoR family transcriptional regulator [Leeia speluncae]